MKTDDVYKLEAEQDVEALIKALREDGDFVVRMQSARALGEICDERAKRSFMPLKTTLSVYRIRQVRPWSR